MTKYVFRIDDIYEFMNLQKLERTLQIFEKQKLIVLLCVTPQWKLENFRGFDFICSKNLSRKDFFSLVKKWEKKGHIIGMHGYEHLMTSKKEGLIKLNNFGEFAGHTLKEQQEKIKKGKQILERNGIHTNIFIPPAHNYDNNTLKALNKEGFTTISDGLELYPKEKRKLLHIPQQFGRVRSFPLGLITIALHPNFMKEKEFKTLEQFITRKRNKIRNYTYATKKKKPNFFKVLLNYFCRVAIKLFMRIIKCIKIK